MNNKCDPWDGVGDGGLDGVGDGEREDGINRERRWV